MAQLIISKIEGDARVIRVTQHGATSIRPACFVADVNEFGGVIIVSTAAGVRSIAVAQRGLSPEEIVVNGTTYATAGEAVQALNAFVGNFKPAGGAAATTFEPNKAYKAGDTIIYDGVMWKAKADFVAGALFNDDDWEKASVSLKDLETFLNGKLDKSSATNKIYGTNEAGAQTTFNKADFETTTNKTTDIRDADHADDDRYPTELAVRTNLNGVFDSIMADMNDRIDDVNEAIENTAAAVGDLSDVAHSTDKSTVVAALNTLFKLLKANIAVEIKTDGLYITRDDGASSPTEARLAELTDLEPIMQEIEGLHGKTARLNGYNFGIGISSDNINDPDVQSMLTAYALAQLGLDNETEIPNFIAVHNLYDGDGGNHLLIFNEAIVGTGTPDNPEFPAHWVDNGLDSVGTASNTSLGVVKGSTADMKVNVAPDGTMSVNGLSTALGTFELVGNKIDEVRDADHATDTKYPTELAVRKSLAGTLDYLEDAKLNRTDDENVIYGTNEAGEQTTYPKDGFGKVDTVNGISPDENKNVQTDYVYATEAEFEADKANIPVGATVIKLYEYPDNLAGFMVVPDYANKESINRISASGQTWTADRSGFIILFTGKGGGAWNSQQVEWYINDIMCETGTAYYVNVILPIQQGDVIRLYANIALNSASCYFIPPKFIKKELPVVVEKNGSYSLDEVKTAETWIDGKPIYRRAFTGTISAAADERVTTTLNGVDNVADIVDCGGWIVANTTSMKKNTFPMVSLGSTFIANLTIDSDMTLVMGTSYASERINAPYNIWVEYTKTTD